MKMRDDEKCSAVPRGIFRGAVLLGIFIILAALIPLSASAAVGEAVKIVTEPQGAAIYIDGSYRGITDSDTVFYGFEEGPHTVELTLPGYQTYTETFYVNVGASNGIYHTFKPVPTKGRIVFSSAPSGADVYLNNRNVGKTGLTLDDVEPGRYQVRISRHGYDDFNADLSVEAGMISEVNADLVLAQVMLSVDTIPSGADVYVDGISVGKSPYSAKIPQGEHTIKAELFGYKDTEETVFIGADGLTRSYSMVSAALEAIEDAQRAVQENAALGFSTARAEEYIVQAKAYYDDGNNLLSIEYAQKGYEAANDEDGDGVVNQKDISASTDNRIIYAVPVIILILIILFIIVDFIKCRVKTEVSIEVPSHIAAGGGSEVIVRAGAFPESSIRAFVCSVYIDGISADNLVETGVHKIPISGEAASAGSHTVSAKVQVLKKRYGSSIAEADAVYTVGEYVSETDDVTDTDHMTDMPDLGDVFSGTETETGGKDNAPEGESEYLSSESLELVDDKTDEFSVGSREQS